MLLLLLGSEETEMDPVTCPRAQLLRRSRILQSLDPRFPVACVTAGGDAPRV